MAIKHRVQAARSFTDDELRKASLIAGLSMYGYSKPVLSGIALGVKRYKIDLAQFAVDGGSGLIWDPVKVDRMSFSDYVVKQLEDGVDLPIVVDDFSYGFNPETSKGQDCAGKPMRSVKSVDGTIYVYDQEVILALTMDLAEVPKKVKDFKEQKKKERTGVGALNTALASELTKQGLNAKAETSKYSRNPGVLVQIPGKQYNCISIYPQNAAQPPENMIKALYPVQPSEVNEIRGLMKKIWKAILKTKYPITKLTLLNADREPLIKK